MLPTYNNSKLKTQNSKLYSPAHLLTRAPIQNRRARRWLRHAPPAVQSLPTYGCSALHPNNSKLKTQNSIHPFTIQHICLNLFLL